MLKLLAFHYFPYFPLVLSLASEHTFSPSSSSSSSCSFSSSFSNFLPVCPKSFSNRPAQLLHAQSVFYVRESAYMQNQHFRGIGGEKEKEGKEQQQQQQQQHLYRDGQMKVPSTAWEELRKEARKLENEIDANLASLSKLAGVGTNNATTSTSSGGGMSGSGGYNQYPNTATNKIEGNFDVIASKEGEIEALLTRLSDVTRALASSIHSGANASSDTRTHTLARHRDVAKEFNHEFRRMKDYIEQEREHASLLQGRHRGSNSALGGGDESNSSAAMRERNSILSSSIAVDDAIGVAQNTASALYEQRGIFNNTISALATAGSKFPVVNNLLVAIKRKKNKDAIVLSAVCAICSALVLIYWMAK